MCTSNTLLTSMMMMFLAYRITKDIKLALLKHLRFLQNEELTEIEGF